MERAKPLVIGFGNRLRSDDGAGILLAEAIAANAPQLRVLTCQQLTPDLAAALQAARAVLFLDACEASSCNGSPPELVAIQPEADPGRPRFSHQLSPTHLLTLSDALYGHCPPAWELLIPGQTWGIGDQLSSAAASLCREALPLALAWGERHA